MDMEELSDGKLELEPEIQLADAKTLIGKQKKKKPQGKKRH